MSANLTDNHSSVSHTAPRPLALIHGEPLSEIPADLYIPPDSLRVFLETFEGPLDLLLYLIKKQSISIENIPVARITEQYMHYINLMEDIQLDIAGDYLVMAAMLTEIKSLVLLPRPASQDPDDEADPRAELVRRLQQYERYKKAAAELDKLPRCERELHPVAVAFPERKARQQQPVVMIENLLQVFAGVLARSDILRSHHIQREVLSVRERMTIVLDKINNDNFIDFVTLFTVTEGRQGVIVAFLAILELLKDSLIEMVQNEVNGPIYIKAAAYDKYSHKYG